MAKYTIESRYCSTFGMDMHARTTTVKGIDRSTGATATKRFDDVRVDAVRALDGEPLPNSWSAGRERRYPRI